MIYLLNSPILTTYGVWTFDGPISNNTASAMINGKEVTSAIGHIATAELLSDLLYRFVPLNRINAALQPGDSALVFRLIQRLPEDFKLLSKKELSTMQYELGFLHYCGSSASELTTETFMKNLYIP